MSLFAASPRTTKYVTMGAQLGVLGLVLWGTRNRRAAIDRSETEQRLYRFGQASIIATAMPLLSPMSSKSHFGILLLPVAYCLICELRGQGDAVVRSLLAAMFVVGTLTVKGIVGTAMGRHILGYGTVTWCALAGLLAAARSLQLQLRTWEFAESDGTTPFRKLPFEAPADEPSTSVRPDRQAA